jgi:hypothetical protein
VLTQLDSGQARKPVSEGREFLRFPVNRFRIRVANVVPTSDLRILREISPSKKAAAQAVSSGDDSLIKQPWLGEATL